MTQQSTHRIMATRSLPPLLPLPDTPPLRGRYRLEAQIGQGKTCIVLRALDLVSGSPCAIKMLRAANLSEASLRQHFESEARILGQHPHPGVVTVRSFDVDEEGRPFIVMELLLGEDLASYLRHKHRIPLRQVCRILRHAAETLHHLHQHGIAHRDVKPSNLFLCREPQPTRDSDALCVKVLNLGTTQSAPSTSGRTIEPSRQALLFSEDIRNGDDSSLDLVGLAAIGYELLSGVVPFMKGASSRALDNAGDYVPAPLHVLCADVPEAVARLFQQAFAKNRTQRFPTIVDFARALLEEAEKKPSAMEASSQIPASSTLTMYRPHAVALPPLSAQHLEEIDRAQGQTVQMEAALLEQLRVSSERSGRQQCAAGRAAIPAIPVGRRAPNRRWSRAIVIIGIPFGLLLGILLAYLLIHLWQSPHRMLLPVSPDRSSSREMLAAGSTRPEAISSVPEQSVSIPIEQYMPPALSKAERRIVSLPLRLADEVDSVVQ